MLWLKAETDAQKKRIAKLQREVDGGHGDC
jgi:hypothetical protein